MKNTIQIYNADRRDSKEEIAACLYDTDPLIYPTAFGSEKEPAINCIAMLIGEKGSLLDYDHILAARLNGHVCGICVYLEDPCAWKTAECFEKIRDMLPADAQFTYASRYYFEEEAQRAVPEELHIMACCVKEEYRRQGIASLLLRTLAESHMRKTISLDVLCDNIAAISLYEKNGFAIVSTQEGFAAPGEPSPKCHTMKREPDKR